MFRVLAFLLVVTVTVSHTQIALAETPSTKELEGDLAEVKAAITTAQDEVAQYKGGLIKTQIELRVQILKNTEAMLEQKRKSILRSIDLDYTIDGKAYKNYTEKQLKSLEVDIQSTKSEIIKQQTEADKYRGGLIKTMQLTAVAIARVTLANLEMRYLTARHGIPLFAPETETTRASPGTAPKKEPVGKVVKDKDAL